MPSREQGKGRCLSQLPRTSRYLATLPAGLASYPDCVLKATYVRAAQDSLPDGITAQDFPFELQALLYHSPSDGDWISEVQMVALMHAMNDLVFDAEVDMLTWAEAGMVRMIEESPFRGFIAMTPPERFPRSLQWVWKNLREGSSAQVVHEEPGLVRGRFEYPAHMFDEFYTRVIASGFMAPMRISRAVNPRTTVSDWCPTSFELTVEYDGAGSADGD